MSKISYFANASIPSRTANSVHIMKMCEALAANGHDVTLCVPDQGLPELRDQDPHAFYGVKPLFRIRKACWMRRHPQGFRDILWVMLSALSLRFRERPETCITRNPWAGLFFPRLGITTVLELHSPLAAGGLQARLYRLAKAFRHPNLVRIVVISSALRNALCAEGAPSEKLLVLHDAVDAKAYSESAPPSGSRRDGLRIGYVGSLNRGKGMEVISAVARLDAANEYHIYGGSPEDVARWRAEGVPSNVELHGHAPNAEVPALLAGFDVVLMPYQRRVSVSGNYGDVASWMSPLKMFEYMAAGKAILSSDLPVLREVLEDGRNALLVDPDDPEAWVSALRKLADPELRARLGATARADVLREYTWLQRAKRILA